VALLASAAGTLAAMLLAAIGLAACSAPAASGPVSHPRSHVSHASPSAFPSSAISSPAAAGALGQFGVRRGRLTVTEPAHTGPAGDQLGPRHLMIQLWYPRPARRPLPLIVFGPGFMQCAGPYAALLSAWASAGYVVAAVNFPLSDCLTGAAATETDLVNQPADMSFAITALLRRSASHRLRGLLLDENQIAIAGQSDGGDTVAAVGANSCCSDRRVRAVAVLSGAEWPAMGGRFFGRKPVPILFTQGDADTVNLPGCSVTMYRADPAWARFYLDLLGADHTGPYWGTNHYERVVASVTLAFFDRYVLGQHSAGAIRRAGHVRGIARLFSHGHGSLRAGPCIT
jgi:dienelactone hydrolase